MSGLVLVDGTDPEQHANDDTDWSPLSRAAISTAVKVPGFAHLSGQLWSESQRTQRQWQQTDLASRANNAPSSRVGPTFGIFARTFAYRRTVLSG